MYLGFVLVTMGLAPLVSIAIEFFLYPGSDLLWLIGKWFVFWAAGIRLLIAGLKQVTDPAFTSRSILGVDAPEAEKLALEIGFGNLAIGTMAALSLLIPDWVMPASLAGAIFLGLAGIQHLRNRNRSPMETTAMLSDIAVAAVLLAFLLLELLT